MMRKLINIIMEANRDVAVSGSDEGKQRIADAMKSLGYAAACRDEKMLTNDNPDPVLSKMIEVACCTFDVQFSKEKTRARDVLTEIAREAGLDMQVAMSTQAKDGSTWLHTYLRDGTNLIAAASARDAARHRDHPDFGSYLFISVKACDDAPTETKYAKKEYTDTEQRECVKITNPAGDVIYDGPKSLFPGLPEAPIKEEITHYEQKGHNNIEPVGELPDASLDDVKSARADAAKRVIAKRAARAAEKD
jgi:hypothetical protein